MHGSRIALGLVAAVTGAALLAGCQESSAGKTQLTFRGRATDAKGQGVNAFALTVSRTPSTTPAKAVNVSAKNGQYEAKVPVDGPAVAGSKTLGSKTEAVQIQVSAAGYKTKSFRVTADQVLVTEPNTLNVTLEPAS